MIQELVSTAHLHPIVDHFTISLLAFGIMAEIGGSAAGIVSRAGSYACLRAWSMKLRSAALVMMVGGAAASVLSYLTGDMEADRLWDRMSPAAQQILLSDGGVRHYLSHAVLGQTLMYVLVVLAAWRVLIEFWPRIRRTQSAFLAIAAVAAAALLYQGKTGGELVYDHAVGVSVTTTDSASASHAAK